MVKGRAWTKAEDIACVKAFVIVSEDPKKGVSQKRADFMTAIFYVFSKFGKENHSDEFEQPGLWPCRSAQSVFQRYKRLKAECLRFEGEYRRASGSHLTGEPRDDDYVRIATAKVNLTSGKIQDSESGHIYEYVGTNAKSPGPAFEHLAVWKQLRETSLFQQLAVSKESQEDDSPDGTASTPEQDDIVSSEVSALPHPDTSASLKRPTGCKRAKKEKFVEANSAIAEGAAGMQAMAAASQERVRIQQESLKLERKKYLLELFSSAETPTAKRRRFFELTQDDALKELEESMSTVAENE
jgi:hypothetical protein